jgi:hypothetical protein
MFTSSKEQSSDVTAKRQLINTTNNKTYFKNIRIITKPCPNQTTKGTRQLRVVVYSVMPRLAVTSGSTTLVFDLTTENNSLVE